MEDSLRAGPGARVVDNSLGRFFSTPSISSRFRHPFTCTLNAAGVRVSKGVVIGFMAHEPVINGVPISGDARGIQPILKLNPGVRSGDATETWVCLEITPNKDGSDDKTTLVEVVHRNAPVALVGLTGRHPLCMVIWDGKAPLRVLPITMFNLLYFRTSPAPGNGAPKHYFR